MSSSVIGLLVIVLQVFCVLFGLYTVYVYRIKRRYAHIPSPKGAWFYLGHIPQIVAKLKKGKNFVDIVTDWQTECGLFLVVWRANQPQIFFSHPDALKEVSMAKFPKGFAFSLIKLWRKQRLAGYGLFTINDHVEWKKKRKIYDPLFGRNHIYSLLTPFNKVSKEFLIDELKSQADGTTSVDMKKIFSFITLQIINIVAFGMDLFNDEYVTSLIRPNDLLFLVNNSLEGVMIEFNNPFISYYRPFLGLKYTTTAYQLREVGRYCIMKRIDDINNGRETPLDILTNIISLTRNHENFTIEDLIDDFVTFIAAGQETTSNMLSFTLILLLRHPEVMERVIEEVDAMYDEEEGDEISLNGLEKLTYMNAAFEESLRLYPPAPIFSKTTDKDMVLNGYNIPKGTKLTTFIPGVCRNPEYYDDPLTFNPSRFEPGQKKPNPYMFYPFGFGHRSCIGRLFAMVEAKVILAQLLHNFDIKLSDDYKLELTFSITFRPANAITCTLTPRTFT